MQRDLWPGASSSLPAATCLGFSKQSREDDAADAEQGDLGQVEAAVEPVRGQVPAQVLGLSRHGATQHLIPCCLQKQPWLSSFCPVKFVPRLHLAKRTGARGHITPLPGFLGAPRQSNQGRRAKMNLHPEAPGEQWRKTGASGILAKGREGL